MEAFFASLQIVGSKLIFRSVSQSIDFSPHVFIVLYRTFTPIGEFLQLENLSGVFNPCAFDDHT